MQASPQKPVVLITGASAGIGEATAHRFAKGGYRVVAVARRKERLEQLARDLSPVTDVEICVADVTHKDTPDRAVELAKTKFGRLDCLVNNAGAFNWAPIHETDDAALDEVIDILLKAPFRFSRAAVKVMKSGSSILSVGSTYGVLGGMNGGGYTMAKHGMLGLTRALAIQYGPEGIRSNYVAPSVVKTDITKDVWEAPFFQRLNHEMTPFNREGTVADVVNLLFFLASDEGSFINGECIAVDGGWSNTKYLCPAALNAKRVGED